MSSISRLYRYRYQYRQYSGLALAVISMSCYCHVVACHNGVAQHVGGGYTVTEYAVSVTYSSNKSYSGPLGAAAHRPTSTSPAHATGHCHIVPGAAHRSCGTPGESRSIAQRASVHWKKHTNGNATVHHEGSGCGENRRGAYENRRSIQFGRSAFLMLPLPVRRAASWEKSELDDTRPCPARTYIRLVHSKQA